MLVEVLSSAVPDKTGAFAHVPSQVLKRRERVVVEVFDALLTRLDGNLYYSGR